ncbi:hypothetical protein HMPREF1544_02609 [Mucor circinelloides 1006PhL]|uniref:Uncharacterized protein n=1 Tax=Mucor circinelloides f. circinelloides (strain 1006PhL) TaxID=1220926 RepID=S2JKR7_MUCC1|nr:hypothetical protein HMPREF1544_02609 [Mucor circinelloides 1006PhL]
MATNKDKGNILNNNIIDFVSNYKHNGAHLALNEHYAYFKGKYERLRKNNQQVVKATYKMLNDHDGNLTDTIKHLKAKSYDTNSILKQLEI